MAQKHKGRRYEREVIDALRDQQWIVRDVSPNTGEYQRHQCDLLITHPRARLNGGDGAVDESVADELTFRAEVKYRKDATSFSKIYNEHLETVGLGTTNFLRWDDGYCSGGLRTLRSYFFSPPPCNDRFYAKGELATNQTLQSWLTPEGMPPRHVLLLRASATQGPTSTWLAVWRSDCYNE